MEIKKYVPENHKIKAVVYGASGSGKTHFGGTAPKPIFASSENGLLSIKDKRPDFVDIRSLQDLTDLYMYLKNQKHDYETVVIDSITEINEIIKAEIEKRTGRPIQKADWAEVGKRIRRILRNFRDLPMHVLFLAQETIEKDDDTIRKIYPSLNGKAAQEIAYYMDVVGYAEVESIGTGKGSTQTHRITTESHPKYTTKDRSKLIGNSVDPSFADWVAKVQEMEVGEQETVHSSEAEPAKELPQPKPNTEKKPTPTKKETETRDVAITNNTSKKLFAYWNDVWSLMGKLYPDARDSQGAYKYAKQASNANRIKTLTELYGVDSSTKLTEKQANDFIDRLKLKYNDLSEQLKHS